MEKLLIGEATRSEKDVRLRDIGHYIKIFHFDTACRVLILLCVSHQTIDFWFPLIHVNVYTHYCSNI